METAFKILRNVREDFKEYIAISFKIFDDITSKMSKVSFLDMLNKTYQNYEKNFEKF